MENETYEQFALTEDVLGESVNYIKENMEISGSMHDHNIIGVTLPSTVDLKIAHTEPGIRGDTAKSGGKPATLETGLVGRVPLFIEQDEIISVDTRTGEYAGRA